MNKRKIIILIFAVIAIMFLNKLIKYNTFYSTGLQGKLIFKNHEICLYDFTTNKLTYLDAEGLRPLFMGKSDEILLVKDNNIYKYNLNSKKLDYITSYRDKYESLYTMQYVDQNHISYVDEEKLILFDINNKKATILKENILEEKHSWSNDGTILYYSKIIDNKYSEIHKFNIQSGVEEKLFKGIEPQASNDGKYIAYRAERGSSTIRVRRMDDGKEWKLSSVNSFKISPDGKSVAILQYYNGIKLSKILSNVLRVWNFEDDEVPIVIEDFSDAFSNMDWIY